MNAEDRIVAGAHWPQNTTQPLREFKRCECHRWRLDECPNVGVAVWARATRAGACCANERRDWSGGCVNCGDPCL